MKNRRKTRKEYVVYPPGWVPGTPGYVRRNSVFQSKKLALKWGPGTQVWVWTRTKARNDEPFLAMTSGSDFLFEVVDE